MRKDQWKIVLISMFLFGIFLFADDLYFHWLGDIGWIDGNNPILHHWYLGFGLIVMSQWLYWRKDL